MSAALKNPNDTRERIPAERREKARQDAQETRALIEAGEHDTVVARIRDRFPKIIARLAR